MANMISVCIILLLKSMMINKKLLVLWPRYSALKGRLAYNEKWDIIIEFYLDSEVEIKNQ